MLERITVIDSHTEGEPTRVVVGGAPEVPGKTPGERLEALRSLHDEFRRAVITEPRGTDAMVGAVLYPGTPSAAAQVIFFNNVGYLGMCVHGAIGVAETLRHLGRISTGSHHLETPVGTVGVSLGDDSQIAVDNVESYRCASQIRCRTANHGTTVGDVAWGGNWFFLVDDHGLELRSDNLEQLTDYAWDVRRSLRRNGISGDDGSEIDHIELFGPPARPDADSKNFVLCPGRQYDRSPCGTGTSAKMACLAADGKLADNQLWHQESIIGSLFTGSVRKTAAGVQPRVAGRAFVTAEATLHLHPSDPYKTGIEL